MKAETLKPFITSPSVTEYVGNRKRNVIVIGLSVFLFIIIASLFGFTIWNSIRVTQLQRRIDSLNKFVDNMHKRLGLDYLDELNEFENNYANHDDLIDDPDDDNDSDEDEGQLLSQLEFDSHDYDDAKHSTNKNHSKEDDDLETGSGNYDDDDDDDDDDDLTYDDDEEDDDDSDSGHLDEDNGDKLFDDYEKFIVAKKRRTRSVSHLNGLKTEQKDEHSGIVNNRNDSQEHNKEHNKDTKKVGAKLELKFDKNDNADDEVPLSKFHLKDLKAINEENIESSIKHHHKKMDDLNLLNIKAQDPQVKHKSKILSISGKNKQHNNHNQHHHQQQHQDHQYHDYVLYPYNTHKKRMHTLVENDDINKQATTPSTTSGGTDNIVLQKNKRKYIKIKNGEENILNQNHRYRTGKLYTYHQERKNLNIIAAHFNLNRLPIREISNKDDEVLLNHQRDFENSIYLPTISPWSSKNQLINLNNQKHHHHHHHQHLSSRIDAENIQMESTTSNIQHQQGLLPSVQNGIVTVQVPGIYYIYAQIFYHNNKERNGYWIYHNGKPFIQCSLTIPNDNIEKANTCYTSGVIYLIKGDTIHLKDMYKDHSAILGTSKSFFGLVRLGDAEYYHYNR
ncbi:protein eiger [Condylostylus longicornis]|uniref:protein eiger n=1 Tax=Condylostylus longicornis TaxID=2530218 RepID=UPI00244DDE2C|nr:protein eiger [Condylostylus longicornis]XP_055380005.1 protein eiger [Condylostylus longicornis]